jgi:uncharacterized protein YndB with AHSA1/START domain
VRFHRVLKASPERVYRAFLDPDALARWLPPHGFTGRVPDGWQESLTLLAQPTEPEIPE